MRSARPPRAARRVGAAVLVVALLALLAGCSDDGGTDDGSAGQGQGGDACPPPEGDLGAYGSATIAVASPDGGTTERCVLVADRLALRQSGLMGITDLAGFDGMLFAYPSTASGGYWMRDTPMPLTIAWIGEDGTVVATADMAPCLDAAASCPVYEPGSTYRWALEVPQGGLAAVGLVDGARLDVDTLPVGAE